MASLRAPGSYDDANYPAAVVADRFFRGSGSSQAAAVVSGRPSPDRLHRHDIWSGRMWSGRM